MTYTEYTTKAGDRWDLIAYAAYGDANKFPEIMAANAGVPAREEIQAGTIIVIPIKEVAPINSITSPSLLPPWKR